MHNDNFSAIINFYMAWRLTQLFDQNLEIIFNGNITLRILNYSAETIMINIDAPIGHHSQINVHGQGIIAQHVMNLFDRM